MGDTFRGGMSLPGSVTGMHLSRPLAVIVATSEGVTLKAVAPLGWLIGPRHLPRAEAVAVVRTAAGLGYSAVDFHTRGHEIFTFWTKEADELLSRLVGLGYRVKDPPSVDA
jgi:hypothetical protein